jgi:excisionase family DNA binding protein
MQVRDKRFLTVGETQAYLGSSRQFIYSLVDKGALDIKKVGRRTYFETEQIEGLFKSKEQK